MKNKVIKEKIGNIWQNKRITRLNTLFIANSNWWVNITITHIKPLPVVKSFKMSKIYRLIKK